MYLYCDLFSILNKQYHRKRGFSIYLMLMPSTGAYCIQYTVVFRIMSTMINDGIMTE